MSASSQLVIATLLSAVAFGCFAFAAGFAGRSKIAAVLGALVWLLVALAVAFLVTLEALGCIVRNHNGHLANSEGAAASREVS